MLQYAQSRFRHGEEVIWLAPIGVAVLLLFLFAHIVGAQHGFSPVGGFDEYGDKALRLLPSLISVGALALLIPALFSRGGSPIEAALRPLRQRFGSPFLLAAALIPLLGTPILLSAYGLLKVLMPLYAPFQWDDSFAAWDRALFLGYQPWTWTHAIFGSAAATVVIDRFYTLWILFISLSVVSFALFVPRYDRARFFLCFTAAWVLLGTVGGYLGSSAGPCYAALIGASSAAEYAPLMMKLNAMAASETVHLDALRWQGVLWDFHSEKRFTFGMGISAMPSLHNAIAVLYALAITRMSKNVGALATLYAVVIFIGSIHLGWHYAVDGIVSTLAMIGIWKVSGVYLERTGYLAAVTSRPEAPAAADAPVPALA